MDVTIDSLHIINELALLVHYHVQAIQWNKVILLKVVVTKDR